MTKLNSQEWKNLVNKYNALEINEKFVKFEIDINICEKINELENELGHLLTCSSQILQLEKIKKNPKVKDIKKYKDLFIELKGLYSTILTNIKHANLIDQNLFLYYLDFIKFHNKSKDKFNSYINELSKHLDTLKS